MGGHEVVVDGEVSGDLSVESVVPAEGAEEVFAVFEFFVGEFDVVPGHACVDAEFGNEVFCSVVVVGGVVVGSGVFGIGVCGCYGGGVFVRCAEFQDVLFGVGGFEVVGDFSGGEVSGG